MLRGGGDLDALSVQRMTKHWLIADRIRFAISFFGFIRLLKAFRLPL